MAIKLKPNKVNYMKDIYKLSENPFRASEVYSIDRRRTYVTEMYGEQFEEFYDKFILRPLSKDTNRQIIGGVWSTHTGDSYGKGFGKTMLMAEEAIIINRDFGATRLRRFGVDEDDIEQHPIVAAYCTFDQSKGVKSFGAALLDAVAFVLESSFADRTVHQELLVRIAERIEADPEEPRMWIYGALMKQARKYRGLNIQLTHKIVASFLAHLCSPDTDKLVTFVRHEIGPRVKATQGFNFVHIFNLFLNLAGIEYAVYFIDQIENFARFVRNQERDLKILRESICQTSPTAEMASFVFQMHLHALQAIEGWWDNVEHLPSLDAANPLNAMRIVDLQGLTDTKQAETLAARYLKDRRIQGKGTVDSLHPFNREVIEAVRQSVKGNPRKFLENLSAILDQGDSLEIQKIDLPFVAPRLDSDDAAISGPTNDEEEYDNPER